jgi:hypothetical protein
MQWVIIHMLEKHGLESAHKALNNTICSWVTSRSVDMHPKVQEHTSTQDASIALHKAP